MKKGKKFADKLNILHDNNLFLFNGINSVEDLHIGCRTRARIIIAHATIFAGGCGFIPISFADVAPVLFAQIIMILGLGGVYGVSLNRYQIKELILSGGCSLGNAGINAGAQVIMKSVAKESSEEVINKVALKEIVKEVLKESG